MAKKNTDKENKQQEQVLENLKTTDLQKNSEIRDNEFLTTDHGVRVNDDQNSLKAGDRGPTLMEDFILREKITHFDRERIPERVVHARGSAAHRFFQVYESMASYTKAKLNALLKMCLTNYIS